MKIEQNIKKTLKVSLIFLVIGLMLGALIVFAATPSSTFYISSGIYPGAPSYTVWKEGPTYYAKDRNGQVEFNGSNATALINSCNDELTSGGKIFVCAGTYYFDSPIMLSESVTLEGEGFNTIFRRSATTTIIKNKNIDQDPSLGYTDIGIIVRNLKIDCVDYTGDIYDDVINFGHTGRLIIENIMIVNAGGNNDAIDFDGCKNVKVSNCMFYSIGGAAIHISDDGGWINHSACQYIKVKNCYADDCGKTRLVAAFNVYCYVGALQGAISNTYVDCCAINCYAGGGIDCYHTGSKQNGFVNCEFYDLTGTRGISLTVGNYSYVDGGYITGSQLYGMWIQASYCTIQNVEIHNTVTHDGIVVYQSEYNTLQDCLCISNGRDGIRLNNVTYTDVKNCKTRHNTANGIGEVTASGVDYSKITGCLAYSNSGVDIITVGGNTICHASLNGTSWIS